MKNCKHEFTTFIVVDKFDSKMNYLDSVIKGTCIKCQKKVKL